MTFNYFVSYTHSDTHGFGFGNTELRLEQPIRSHTDVQGIETLLRQHGVGNPTVLSFTLFGADAEQTEKATTAPMDGLAFAYIEQLLIEQKRPLTDQEIADLLDFSLESVRRITARAVFLGRLTADRGAVTLPANRRRGRS